MSDFDTLIPDINKLFEGKDLSARVHHLTNSLGDTFVTRFLEYATDRTPTLRLSNVGKPLRQLWYELKGYPREALSPEVKFKFLYGSLIESLVLYLAKEAGHSVEQEQQECFVDGVKGHIDAVIDGVLVDVKSCSTRSFEKFQSGKVLYDDPFGYIGQLSGYAKALGVKRAAFIAIDKVLGRICILELTPQQIAEYDILKRIHTVRTALTSEQEPERCYEPQPVSKSDKSGNLVLAVGCSYCGFKEHCWRDTNNNQGLQTRWYSTGPKYFIKIVKEPKLKSDYESFPVKD